MYCSPKSYPNTSVCSGSEFLHVWLLTLNNPTFISGKNICNYYLALHKTNSLLFSFFYTSPFSVCQANLLLFKQHQSFCLFKYFTLSSLLEVLSVSLLNQQVKCKTTQGAVQWFPAGVAGKHRGRPPISFYTCTYLQGDFLYSSPNFWGLK